MNSDQINSLQQELLKIKKGLKDWEHVFSKKHQRKPTVQDIQARPKVERVYKDYNTKKKQLRKLSLDSYDSQSQSQPIALYDSQVSEDQLVTSCSSQSPHKRRRGSQASIEYIRSPSHRLSRMKHVDRLAATKVPDFEEKLNHVISTNTTDNASSTQSRKDENQMSEEDLFWLGPSLSQSTSQSSHHHDDNSTTDTQLHTLSSFLSSDTQKKKKKKKKNAALEQKLFGHLIWKPRDTLSPALKAERDSQPTTPKSPTDDPLNSHASTQHNIGDYNTNNSDDDDGQQHTSDRNDIMLDTQQVLIEEGRQTADDDNALPSETIMDNFTLDTLIITERQLDPFRHFDPSLKKQMDDDPDFFVMPGLFSSTRARSTTTASLIEDDPDRHQRIMEALQKGTLGEKRSDNYTLDIDDNLKQFIEEHNDIFINEPSTAEEDHKQQSSKFRKKFTQRRQTRLHKFRYVETTASTHI